VVRHGAGIDEFYGRALTMLASPKVKAAFDLSRETPAARDAYGRTTYGQSCLLARRLIEAGVRFVSVYYSASIGGKGNGGWDTHGDNFNQLKDRLLPNTDRTVPALIEDLAARGLLDETLVVWMGEFGRSPKVTNTPKFGPDGRDHWPQCYTALFAGGGVTAGAVYGSSDRIGAYPASDPVAPDDLAATMYWALGIDPHAEVLDRSAAPCRSPRAGRSRRSSHRPCGAGTGADQSDAAVKRTHRPGGRGPVRGGLEPPANPARRGVQSTGLRWGSHPEVRAERGRLGEAGGGPILEDVIRRSRGGLGPGRERGQDQAGPVPVIEVAGNDDRGAPL
jgi:hypothetical protein